MRKSRLTLDGASLTLDQLRQFERERPELPALALTPDSGILTAMASGSAIE